MIAEISVFSVSEYW